MNSDYFVVSNKFSFRSSISIKGFIDSKREHVMRLIREKKPKT